MASFGDKLKAISKEDNSKIETASVFALNDIPVVQSSELSVQADDESWILNTNYKYTDTYGDGQRYEDSDYSYIDEKKTITINPNQINLTQENNSQYIPFEMFRYYDGIDLNNMTLYIYFVNKNGDYGLSSPINVKYNDTKIRFGFLVSSEATAVSGKLKLEIQARGTSPLGGKYLLKTKPNDDIEILESLQGNGNVIIDESWATTVLEDVQNAAIAAESFANDALTAATDANQALATVDEKINNISDEISSATYEKVMEEISSDLSNYYTKTETYNKDEIDEKTNSLELDLKNYTDNAVQSVDVTEQLKDYATLEQLQDYVESSNLQENYYNKTETKAEISSSLNGYATENFVQEEISKVDISDKLTNYYTKEEIYSKEETDEKLENVTVDLSDYATKTYVQDKETALSSSIQANTTNITSLSSTVQSMQEKVDSVDTSPRLTYDVVYNDPDNTEVGENGFGFYEIQNEGESNEIRSLKKKFTIVGGSGGGATSSTLKIGYVTTSPLVATADDKVLIKYNFSGTDSSGDDVTEGSYTWKIGSKVIATGIATNGENTFDATDFVSIGTQKLVLSVTDSAGSLVTKSWTVQIVDVRIESTFNDTQSYPTGKEVSFNYTPYGAIQKTIHFKVDGTELFSTSTTSSGIPMSYSIQPRSHGSHLVEVYITAQINNSAIESNHIFKDVIWYDSSSEIPVIGCTSKDLTVKQYDTASITYTVYDSSTETPTVILAVDGKTTSTLTLETNTQTWQYKATEVGSHVLTITCGETVKTINVLVEELDIDVSPVTAGLEFDFNPIGYSNSDVNRLWSDGDVSMTVSDNFDWVNGGYQVDDNGDQYFCVKSGTTATVNYNLFADDPKRNGKEFKVIFKTTNVRKRNSSFITCMNSGIGLDMKIESANIYSSNDSLYSPYCEDDIIEFEFNINKDTDISMVLTYEDGVANRPMIYTSDSSFLQESPQPIVIGSEDCDVHIYRMKAYSNSLTDRDILSNFIADARNAEEMISRYNRNQIYDENGSLDPYVLAEKCPDLRIILVDCPHFTTDKSDKVKNTNITMIYKNGDPILDNWTCINAAVSGRT